MNLLKTYYQDANTLIYHADCREVLSSLAPADCIIADPPYGITSLKWDKVVEGWISKVNLSLQGSLWHFGSFKFFMEHADEFKEWRLAQDVVWEKHNGSGLHADRFKRVHELVGHFYRKSQRWSDVFKNPLYTTDETKRTTRTKRKPPHMGGIERPAYVSQDGGPRLQRSILKVRSCHGYAEHPTQKPIRLLQYLIEYSCPAGGLVVDPFMGSGATLLAARSSGKKAIGIEIDEKYCEIAASKLAQSQVISA